MGESLPVRKGHQLAVAPPGKIRQAVLLAPTRQRRLALKGQAQQLGRHCGD
jgi:hypothetical protein